MKNPSYSELTDPIQIFDFETLEDRKPQHALVENTDLVVTRFDDDFSVLYGRCLHRAPCLRMALSMIVTI